MPKHSPAVFRLPALFALAATAVLACAEVTAPIGAGEGQDGGAPPPSNGSGVSPTPTPTPSATDGAIDDGGSEAPDASAPDASEPDASEPDASAPDASEPDASAPDASAPDAGGGGAGGPELVSPANCPRSIVHHAGVLYWTEAAQPGFCPGQPITPGIRSAPVTGTSELPKPLFSGDATSAPAAVSVVDVKGVTTLFFTNGQGPNNNDLWRLDADGGVTRWGPAPGPIGPGALVGDGELLYWTSSSGTHLSETGAAGRIIALDTGIGALAGGSVQSVALDAENVYSIRNQDPTRGVFACPRGKDCSGGSHTTIALEPDLHAVASDGTNVWFLGGSPAFEAKTTEKLFKCPTSGCPGGAPTLFASTATDTNGGGTHHAIAVDDDSVYFGTIEGKIYRCAKDACASPTPIASGVRPESFAHDKKYLYWTDRRGGIYRIAK